MEGTPEVFEPIYNFFLKKGVYHALYKASEYIGGETWGDNIQTYTEVVKHIPDQQRKDGIFRMLLLGSATSTSIKQAVDALKGWQDAGIINQGKLTVIDISKKGLNRLPQDARDLVEFVQADLSHPPFQDESFDFISSDYILNFIPKQEIPAAINGLIKLLKGEGIISTSIDTKKNILSSMFVRNGLSRDDLNHAVPSNFNILGSVKALSRGLANISTVGANRIVWSVQKAASAMTTR